MSDSLFRENGLFTADAVDFPYLRRHLRTRYNRRSGIFSVPVAAPPTAGVPVPCEVIMVHAPVEEKNVAFDLIRLGELPDTPAPVAENADEFLVRRDLEVSPPVAYGQGGSYAFQVIGEYTVAVLVPRGLEDGFPQGQLPGDTSPAIGNVLTPFAFDTSLLNGPAPIFSVAPSAAQVLMQTVAQQ